MFITIDKESNIPMFRQIFENIKRRILGGELTADMKLPSTRSLAKELNISRIVVLEAYEQLFAEGYVYSIEGSGTYISNIEHLNAAKQQSSQNKIINFDNKELRTCSKDGLIDIRTGAPDFSLFPIKKWGSIYKEVCAHIKPEKLDYYNPEGSYQLRVQLLKYLNRTRGIFANPNQVFITTGAAQGFTLLSRLLLDKDTRVILEDPINSDIYKMLIGTGAEILSIPVDNKGINTNMLPSDAMGKLVFTTPSHQFPLGSILTIQRRLELIEFVNKSNGYIIEDDYDSAFRFKGSPINSLHTLDSSKVIYTGTFSKLLFPALRIGYLILPVELVSRFKQLKHLEDLHTPVLEQITLAKFIEQGLLEKHIARCKKVYKEKNQTLVKELKKFFGDDVNILGDSAGIHLVAKFKNIVFDESTSNALKTFGLKISSINPHTQFPQNYKHHLMIGYGHLSLTEIKKSAEILSKLNLLQSQFTIDADIT